MNSRSMKMVLTRFPCGFETGAIGPIHERNMQLVPVAISKPTTLLDMELQETKVGDLKGLKKCTSKLLSR